MSSSVGMVRYLGRGVGGSDRNIFLFTGFAALPQFLFLRPISICGGGWRSFDPSQAQIQEIVRLRITAAAVELHESKTWAKRLAVYSAAFFLSMNGLSILPDALTRWDGPLGPVRWTTKSLTSLHLYRTLLLWIHLYPVHCRKEQSLPLVLELDNIPQKSPLDHGLQRNDASQGGKLLQRKFLVADKPTEVFLCITLDAQQSSNRGVLFFFSLLFSSFFFHIGRQGRRGAFFFFKLAGRTVYLSKSDQPSR